MADTNQKSKAQVLRTCGRELATDMYESAIKTATNNEMMNDQIRVVTNAAVHLIALLLYNIEWHQGEVDDSFTLQIFEKEIKKELAWLRNLPSDQLVYSKPEGNVDGRITEEKESEGTKNA